MRIVIDGRMIGWTGIGRYSQELIQHLARIDKDHTYIILLDAGASAKLDNLPANFHRRIVNIRPYGLKEQLVLPFILYGLRPDLVHFTHFNAPPLYFGRRVTTIHDLTLVRYKTNRGNGPSRIVFELKYWFMRLILRCAVMRSNAILTPSVWVKRDIVNFYRRSSLRRLENKIFPTLEAVSQAANPSPSQPSTTVKGPFLLYVGNYYPNKNIPTLVTAFKQLLSDKPNLKLVLVGPDDYFLRTIKRRVGELGLESSVIITGRLSYPDLIWFYKNAVLFVFPSLSEGFGLPPLEAMAQGTPVISSDATCMPEILGTAADYFDPHDPSDMAVRISRLLDDPKALSGLRKAGLERVKQFSWGKMVEETLAVYKQVLGE